MAIHRALICSSLEAIPAACMAASMPTHMARLAIPSNAAADTTTPKSLNGLDVVVLPQLPAAKRMIFRETSSDDICLEAGPVFVGVLVPLPCPDPGLVDEGETSRLGKLLSS